MKTKVYTFIRSNLITIILSFITFFVTAGVILGRVQEISDQHVEILNLLSKCGFK